MSARNAKVSLIVPVFNVEGYLERCLDSCVRQTLLDLEILCVNDGSTDGSREILTRYAAEDSRIRIIDRENGGVSAARNTGLDAARGEWIMFLDADDYLEPEACARVWAESMEERTDIIIFGGTFFPELPKPENEEWLRKTLGVRTVRFRSFRPEILFREPGAKPFIWLQAYSAAFLERNGLRFDEAALFAEDILFQFSAFPLAKRFSFLSDALYHYRIGREGSLMDSLFPTEKAEWHLRIAELAVTAWERYGIAERYRRELGEWVMDFAMGAILFLEPADQPEYLDRTCELIKRHGLEEGLKELPTFYRKEIRRIRGNA